jgi:hypothetical protein
VSCNLGRQGSIHGLVLVDLETSPRTTHKYLKTLMLTS